MRWHMDHKLWFFLFFLFSKVKNGLFLNNVDSWKWVDVSTVHFHRSESTVCDAKNVFAIQIDARNKIKKGRGVIQTSPNNLFSERGWR